MPTLPREIDYEAFCAELIEWWELAQLAIPEDNSVPTEMHVRDKESLPILDDEA